MPRLPQRLALSAQAADIIKEMIDNQELKGILPGERTLSASLQIGRDTLRAALEVLEAERWIAPREHGKRRKIIKSPGLGGSVRPSRTKRVAYLSPKRLGQLPPDSLLEVDHLRNLLNKQGYELDLFAPGLFHLRDPARKLEQLLRDKEADAWILHQCPPPVQTWFEEQNIPALVRGYPQPGVTLPCIDEDWKAAAFHAGGILKRHGHHNIGLLMPDASLAGLRATEEGLTKAVETSGGTVHLLIDRREPDSVANLLEHTFRLKNPPTALVASRSRYVLTILSWLAARRLKIPDDLSLIAVCYDKWFDHLIPSITCYHLESQAIARSVVCQLLQIMSGASPGKPARFLIPECIPGESVRARE